MFVALTGWRRSQGRHWSEEARLSWPARRVGTLYLFMLVLPLATPSRRPCGLSSLSGDHRQFPLRISRSSGGFAHEDRMAHAGSARRWPCLARPKRSHGSLVPPYWASTCAPGTCSSASLPGPAAGSVDHPRVRDARSRRLQRLGLGMVDAVDGILRPASARLRAIVAVAAQRKHLRPRAVEEAAVPIANAFALVGIGSIAVTDATLAVLTDDELACVCATSSPTSANRGGLLREARFWFHFPVMDRRPGHDYRA